MQQVSAFQYKIKQSRSKIAHEYAALGDKLNLSKRLQHSVQQKPVAWIAGLFFTGIALPWFFKKSVPPTFQQSTHQPISPREKKSSRFSKITFLASPLLQNKTVQAGLVSAISVLFPFVQEVIAEHVYRKQAKK
jgi:hypothetical protein